MTNNLSKMVALFCGLLAVLGGHAQHIDGIWKGTLTQETGGCFTEYHLELQITSQGQAITGNSYDYYDNERFVRHQFSGTVDTVSRQLRLVENQLVEVRIPANCIACTKIYSLTWNNDGAKDKLAGSWTGTMSGNAGVCPPGQITLYRSATSAFPAAAPPVRDSNLAKLEKRENQLFGSLVVQTREINIDLYDNAEIDNDTVTVFLNDRMLLYRQRLTDKPLRVTINVEKDVDYELVMYANNLGSIPPNTALMVVTAGRQKQEIRLSASDKKNASVKFRLKE